MTRPVPQSSWGSPGCSHAPCSPQAKGGSADSRQRPSEVALPSRRVSPLLQKLRPGVGSLAGRGLKHSAHVPPCNLPKPSSWCFFFFFSTLAVFGILVPYTGIEPAPSGAEAQSSSLDLPSEEVPETKQLHVRVLTEKMHAVRVAS